MKATARILLAVSMLGLGAVATSGSALADGAPGAPWQFTWRPGCGSPATYDGYVFAGGCPVYTGYDVTATAVDLTPSGFRHRRVVGPGVVFHRPHPYWW